ncbi:MAG: hypothetical protein GXP30_12280 [Verrucomicrobia bacterium]|nr:hypothetical protein [Verrucomicrobiota bacterium]
MIFLLGVWVLFTVLISSRAEEKHDIYGGVTAIKGQKTGWFHVEEIDGRWFFVTPEGNAFFSLGVTHAKDCIRKDELGLFASKFDKDPVKLSEFILERSAEWGYNTAGYGVLPAMEKKIPYVASIWTEGPRSRSVGERSKNTDIFDLKVQERLRVTVREKAERHIGNPFCLGYVFIDLPIWHPASGGRKGGETYVDYIRGLAPEEAGRKAYVIFLEKQYQGNVTKFAGIYGVKASSFDALASSELSKVQVRKNNKVKVDDELFLNQMADVYYECVVGELRKLDPNHLVLGDRLMALPERTPDSIIATAAKYVDVITFQPMGTKKLIGGYIDHIFELTDKPVFLADVNTMTMRPEKGLVDSSAYERAAGEYTQKYYLDAIESKYCIGINRCTIRDYQPWNPKFHRRGLLKADDSPYSVLIDYTQRVNKQVLEQVYKGAASKRE